MSPKNFLEFWPSKKKMIFSPQNSPNYWKRVKDQRTVDDII